MRMECLRLRAEALDVEGFEEGGRVVRFDQDGKPTGITVRQSSKLGEPDSGLMGGSHAAEREGMVEAGGRGPEKRLQPRRIGAAAEQE